MRAYSMFCIIGLVACGSSDGSSGGLGNTSDGGSTSQCSGIVQQICQKAISCSAGGNSGVVFVIGANDAGMGSYDFTLNSASGNNESGCEKFVGAGCDGSHAAQFIAECGAATSSGLQCGPSVDNHGNGVMIPAACWQSL